MGNNAVETLQEVGSSLLQLGSQEPFITATTIVKGRAQ